jgi:hypothetical protein
MEQIGTNAQRRSLPVHVGCPLPLQGELLAVSPETAVREYLFAFKNDSVHLPEVALRYLVWLIVADAPSDQIRSFVLQIRNELNSQRLAEFVRVHGSI